MSSEEWIKAWLKSWIIEIFWVDNSEKEDIKKLEKENSLLKEKLNQLKSEHQKDLDSLNNIIEKLGSVLGEENVWSRNFSRW